MFASRQRPPGRFRPGAQSSPRLRKQVILGAALLLAVVVLANTGGQPSARKAQRAAERQLADRTLEVQDLGGTQQVAIQQGGTTTVIQQDPDSPRPILEVHNSDGVQTASKYKPLDTPGIEVTKGGKNDSSTVVHVGKGDSKQSIELLRASEQPATTKPTARTAADVAASQGSTQAQATINRARGKGVAQFSDLQDTGLTSSGKSGTLQNTALTSSGKSSNLHNTALTGSGNSSDFKDTALTSSGKSSLHGGSSTLDSPRGTNVTDRTSKDQKEAIAKTDKQKSSWADELLSSSSSADQSDSKGPVSRGSTSGAVSSVTSAVADAADSLKKLVSNDTEEGCTEAVIAKLPQLKVEKVWKPSRAGADTDVTLATQLTLDSLSMLQSQCELWAGPLAAVAYMPLVKGSLVSLDDATLNGSTVEEQISKLAQVVADINQAGPCRLTLELVSEQVQDVQQAALYPFNALRNRALQLVKTEMVVLLDVEFLPPEGLMQIFSVPSEYQSTLVFLYNGAVVVLPAFETLAAGALGQQLALKLAKGSKQEMMDAIVEQQVRQWQATEYEKGQRATDYTTWLTSQTHYSVKFEEGYEPFVISARKNVPWYDERFRGEGQDRTVHTLHMAGSLNFAVHPTAFVVRQPRPVSQSAQLAKSLPQYTELSQTYSKIRASILTGKYEPVSVFPCQHNQTSNTTATSLSSDKALAASTGSSDALNSQGTGASSGASQHSDVAQQLQQAQRESAERRQGTTDSLTSSLTEDSGKSSGSNSTGASLGLSTGSSSAADSTALSAADESSQDPAEKLKQAQQYHVQQAAAIKREGNTAGDGSGADANGAGSSERHALNADGGAGFNSAAEKGAAGDTASVQKVGNADAASSTYGKGVGDLPQITDSVYKTGSKGSADKAQAEDATDAASLGSDITGTDKAAAAGLSHYGSGKGAGSSDAAYGVTDSAVYGSGTAGTDKTAYSANDVAAESNPAAHDRSDTRPDSQGMTDYERYAESEDSTALDWAAAADASAYVNELEGTGTSEHADEYVQEMQKSGAASTDASLQQQQEKLTAQGVDSADSFAADQ